MTSVSHFLRMARASSSKRRANSIIGSFALSTAALPPSNSFMRYFGSLSLVPLTSAFATSSGLFTPSSFLMIGESAPNSSRILVRLQARVVISNSS